MSVHLHFVFSRIVLNPEIAEAAEIREIAKFLGIPVVEENPIQPESGDLWVGWLSDFGDLCRQGEVLEFRPREAWRVLGMLRGPNRRVVKTIYVIELRPGDFVQADCEEGGGPLETALKFDTRQEAERFRVQHHWPNTRTDWVKKEEEIDWRKLKLPSRRVDSVEKGTELGNQYKFLFPVVVCESDDPYTIRFYRTVEENEACDDPWRSLVFLNPEMAQQVWTALQ